MGKIKYIDKIRNLFKESPVVSLSSLKRFIKKNSDYAYLLINNLLKKGEIKRITKGYYTIHDDPSLAVFCFKPAYLGLQDALSIHALWEQETNPVIITSRKIRRGIRKIFSHNVILRNINSKYFFGFEYKKEGHFYFPVSDVEKTFIDMIYFNEHLDNDVIKEFNKRINKGRLKNYLKRYPKRFKDKVSSIAKISKE